MKNILYIASYIPFDTPFAGSKTSYGLLKKMAKKFSISIFVFYNSVESSYFDGFKNWLDRRENISFVGLRAVSNRSRVLMACIFFLFPSIMSFRFSFRLILYSFRKRRQIDTVYVDFSQSLLLGWFVSRLISKPLVISMPDVLLQSFRRKSESSRGLWYIFFRFECFKLAVFERLFVCSADLVIVQSFKDKSLLVDIFGVSDESIEVLSPSFYRRDGYSRPLDKTVLLWGAYNRVENEEAFWFYVSHVHPVVRDFFPNYRFVAAGANPSSDMIRLASVDRSIIVTGFLDDPVTVFSQAKIAVVPLLTGAGIKVKCIETLYFGIPTVASSIGSEGIPAIEGLITINNLDQFSDAVIGLLDNDICFDRSQMKKNVDSLFDFNADAQRVIVRLSNV